MLLKMKQLIIENNGYSREIASKYIYLNSDSIVSISDYDGVENFLLSEKSKLAEQKFSLVKINHGSKIESLIIFGPAESVYAKINKSLPSRQILND